MHGKDERGIQQNFKAERRNPVNNFYFLFIYRICMCAKSVQSFPMLCNPIDCSPPGSSDHETLQARILEWIAITSSKGSSQPRDGNYLSYVSCISRWILYH